VGLPDTIWFPKAALADLPDDKLSFLLFPVEQPQFFDAVVLDDDTVREIQVKRPNAASKWIWGAFKMPGSVFAELRALWHARDCEDEYFGTLINAWLSDGGSAVGVKAGTDYVDIGTLNGYRAALTLLSSEADRAAPTLGWPAGRQLQTQALT
jgi:NDP-sugar pyrophosphorylase family protein